MKYLFTFFILIQTAGTSVSAQDSVNRFSIFVSPSVLIPFSIAVQPGMQFRVNNQLSFLTEIAIPVLKPDAGKYVDAALKRVGLEAKYQLKSRLKSLRRYAALQTNYLYREFRLKEGSFTDKNGNYYFDSAHVSSNVLATAFKMGAELFNRDHFFVDVFAGIGVRFINTTYQTKNRITLPGDPDSNNSLFSTDFAWRFNYPVQRLHLTAGLRFGMHL